MVLTAMLQRVYQTAFRLVVILMERGLLPDVVVR